MSAIKSNLHHIRTKIAELSQNPVRLVAVSKLKPAGDLMEAYDADQRHFGENYVSELVGKCSQLPVDINWHFIGHLQSNKVNKLVSSCPNLHMIETVDSVKLANKLEAALKSVGRTQRLLVLVEVKTSTEESKSGIDCAHVPDLVRHIQERCHHLKFDGLMTIADAADPLSSFASMNQLRSDLVRAGIDVRTMSMGMSGDLQQAIACGSTQVRIGSSIFGSR